MHTTALYGATEEALDQYLEDIQRPSDVVLRYYLKDRRYIGSRDRQAITTLYYGVLRDYHALSYALEQASWSGPKDERAKVLLLAYFARHQGEAFLPSLQAAIEATQESPHGWPPLPQHQTQLLEALVAFWQAPTDPAAPELTVGFSPQILDLFHQQVPADKVTSLLSLLKQEAPTDIRVNPLKISRSAFQKKLTLTNWASTPTPHSPFGLRLNNRYPITSSAWFREGLIEIQDEGAQLLALATDAQPGLRVLDYCAGAGGKSLLLGAMMQNKGQLIVADIAANRLTEAVKRCRRAGVSNYQVRHLEDDRKWFKRHQGYFDIVLVDAPCTGSGTWRRHVDAPIAWQNTKLDELVLKQSMILSQAAKLVKPGGYMVYGTCSIFKAENDDQVASFLTTHPYFSVAPLPTSMSPLATPEGYLRLYPTPQGPDGFFAVRLQRDAEPLPEVAPSDASEVDGEVEANELAEAAPSEVATPPAPLSEPESSDTPLS